jgi:hypothetical protein
MSLGLCPHTLPALPPPTPHPPPPTPRSTFAYHQLDYQQLHAATKAALAQLRAQGMISLRPAAQEQPARWEVTDMGRCGGAWGRRPAGALGVPPSLAGPLPTPGHALVHSCTHSRGPREWALGSCWLGPLPPPPPRRAVYDSSLPTKVGVTMYEVMQRWAAGGSGRGIGGEPCGQHAAPAACLQAARQLLWASLAAWPVPPAL